MVIIGPSGEKRPHGVVANAVHVMEIATGIREEKYVKPNPRRRNRKKAVAVMYSVKPARPGKKGRRKL